MKIGLQIPHFRPSQPDGLRGFFKEIVQSAEANDFYSVWLMDHFFQLGGNLGEPETPMVEGYSTLGYFAGITERIKLGLMVGGAIYRHPAIVVKSVSTLDVLSGGRMYFGIGAAWNDHESNSLGIRFPPTKERFEQLEDILRLAYHMWSGDTGEFKGTHVTAPYPVNNPQPISKPHPPILIGGMGERKTLRLVAQYADATNLFGSAGRDTLRHKLGVLKAHCDDLGRDYDEIEKTTLFTLDMTKNKSRIMNWFEMFRDLGFSHVLFNLRNDYSAQKLDRFGKEIMPELKDF